MPMIDDVAESLVGESQLPGRPSDASTSFVESVPYQFAFTFVHFFFERPPNARILGFRDGRVRDSQSGASTQTRGSFRIQLVSQPFIGFLVYVSHVAQWKEILALFENREKHPAGYLHTAA